MRKGEKRKLDLYCTVCHKLRILRLVDGVWTPPEQLELAKTYVCSDHRSTVSVHR